MFYLTYYLLCNLPSGILWIVIADTSNILFFKDVELLKLPLFFNALSKNLSDNSTNNAPMEKPIAGNTHSMYPSSPDKSIAGASNDQN